MNENDWIKKLKAGDKVFVGSRDYYNVMIVEKTTPTGLIKVGGDLYNEYGYLRGGDVWSRTHLIQWSREEEDKLRRGKYTSAVLRKLRELKDSDITYAQAVAIAEIMKVKQ